MALFDSAASELLDAFRAGDCVALVRAGRSGLCSRT